VSTPPVLGFNNNVRHRGRVFHIQTEDSGVKSPRIVTHLFADGGRIIKTARTSYSELVGRPDLSQVVRQLMKEQHKAMFTALREGALDALLEAACGPLPLPPAQPGAVTGEVACTTSGLITAVAAPDEAPPSARDAPATGKHRTLSTPNFYPISPSVAPASQPPVEVAAGSRAKPAQQGPALRGPAKSESSATRQGSSATRQGSPAAARSGRTPAAPAASSARPASRYGSVPSKSAQSIFGDGVISEKSLDEVILSYLAEDLDGSSD
jgi:hypothetical protein